ncbi:MAG: DUF4388 domain-containing protein [Candidatus Eisenbacteria bacterium]|nr:DUF4388 domain-containing protein [Candidatus Eisenbacteria bacterium]
MSGSDETRAGDAPEIRGSLRAVNLLDICQFFLLNGKSGTLRVSHRGGEGRLFFDGGRIINALDDRQGREGREAALGLFRVADGEFLFRVESVHERRRIEEDTENLLLEAARQLDEIRDALGPQGTEGDGPSAEEGLLEKRRKAEDLHDLFSDLEKELDGRADLPPPERILQAAEESGADLILLQVGRFPYLLRGERVLRALPGVIGEGDLAGIAGALGAAGGNGRKGRSFRLIGDGGNGFLAFRRMDAPPSLQEINLSPGAAETLLRLPPGLFLLVAEPAGARRLLYDAVLHHLGLRGELVVMADRSAAPEEKGLFLAPADDPERNRRASWEKMLAALPGARAALPEIRKRRDALLALDLARAGHAVVAPLPGRNGAEALLRAASWFREDGSLRSAASLIAGVAALQIHSAGPGRTAPVTSLAAWNDEAAAALAAEDGAALAAALERSAGDEGFRGSIARLERAHGLEKSEADRIASLLPV